MTEQMDLLAAITDKAIVRVGKNADPTWTKDALACITALAEKGESFTTDAVWELLEQVSTATTHERRALGAVMRTAQRQGLIQTTGRYVKSTRPECHTRPCAVWVGKGAVRWAS